MNEIIAIIIYLITMFILCSALPFLHCWWVNRKGNKKGENNG